MSNARFVGLKKQLAGGLAVCGATLLCVGSALAGPKGAVGDLYVANHFGSNVIQYDGITGALVGTFADVNMTSPFDLAFGPNGNLFVVDDDDGNIKEYDGNTGAFVGTFISTGQINIQNILFTPNGTVLVSDAVDLTINEYDATTGAFIGTFATNIQALQNGLAMGPNGNVFAGDNLTMTVHQYALDGTDLGVFASGGNLINPEGIAFGGPNGNLFVASLGNDIIIEYDGTTGGLIGTFAPGPVSPDGLRFGPNGNLWVSGVVVSQFNEYDSVTGEIILSNTDGLFFPRGITFKPASGPNDCLTLTVSTLTAGQSASWDVSGATAGSLVAVVYGLQAGSTVVNGQLGFCATFGIQGVNQNKSVGTAVADGSGNASIVKTVPGGAVGLTVLTQAAEKGTCPNECVSNLDTQVVQ